jgi:hypothetical protein
MVSHAQPSIGEENLATLQERYLVLVEVSVRTLEKKEDALVNGSKDEVRLNEEMLT